MGPGLLRQVWQPPVPSGGLPHKLPEAYSLQPDRRKRQGGDDCIFGGQPRCLPDDGGGNCLRCFLVLKEK